MTLTSPYAALIAAIIVALKAEVAVDTSKYSIDRNSHTSVGGIVAGFRRRS